DYAPTGTLVIIEDIEEFKAVAAELITAAEKTRVRALEAGIIAPDHPVPYLTNDAYENSLASHTVLMLTSSGDHDRWFVPGQRFGGQLKTALSHMRGVLRSGGRAVMVTQQTARLSDVWYQQGVDEHLAMLNDLPIAPLPG